MNNVAIAQYRIRNVVFITSKNGANQQKNYFLLALFILPKTVQAM